MAFGDRGINAASHLARTNAERAAGGRSHVGRHPDGDAQRPPALDHE